jgi:hypothetical protein
MRTCPGCSLLNPDAAVMCDCGYAFDRAQAKAALAGGFRPQHEVNPPGPSKGAKFGFGVLGYFLGCLPLVSAAEREAASGHGESPVLQGLGVLSGIAGIFIALRLLKMRHESVARAKRGGPQ